MGIVMSDDIWNDYHEYCREIRNAKEKDRIVYATNRITELGYTCKWIEQSKCLQFDFKGSTVRLFPYTGWFSGKTVKDGRGLNNLLKQINI
jgi:hypothetical protein